MEKNYGSKLTAGEREKIKKQLDILKNNKNYQQVLKKNGITSLSNLQITNLSEFMAQEDERYDNHNYRTNEDLQRVCTFVSKTKNIAVMINIPEDEYSRKNSKIPEGEFGTYDLETNKFKMAQQLQGKLEKQIEKEVGKLYFKSESEREQYKKQVMQKLSPKNLDGMEKLVTMGINRAIQPKIQEENRRNGKSLEEQKELERESRNRKKEQNKEEKDKEEDEKMPKEVQEAMKRSGGGQVVRYFYLDARELGERVDDAKVRKNGGKVLMMEIADGTRVSGPNRYYAFQNDKMVLWGNADKDVKEVVGKVTKMGQVIRPLRMHEPEYIEYRDNNGVCVKELIDDRKSLSVGERERFKKEMQQSLKQYSLEIEKILEKDREGMLPEEIYKEVEQLDQRFDSQTYQKRKKYDISMSDGENIAKQTDPKEIVKQHGYEKQLGPQDKDGRYGFYDD